MLLRSGFINKANYKMSNKPTYKELEKTIIELKKQHKAELIRIEKKNNKTVEAHINKKNKYKKITNISEQVAKAGSWSLDTKTNDFFCSDGMCIIHGIKPEEFDNSLEMLRKYIHPDDIEEVIKKSNQSILEKKSFVFEYRMLLSDGSVRYIRGKNTLIFNEAEELIEIIGMNMDISELKKHELLLNKTKEQLKNERNQFLSLLNTIPEPIYVSDTKTMKILFANDAKKKIYGDELVEKRCFEALHNLNEPCNFCPTIEKLNNKEQAIRWVKEDKKNKKTFLNIEKLIEWQDNQNARFQIAFDITELKKAENEIRKLSVAVEQNPTTIVITDTEGNIEYVNNKFTELTGYTFKEAKGKNASVLNSGRTNTKIFIDLWNTLKMGKVWKGEFINKKKNGEKFIEYATIAPIFDENNKTTNYIAIKEDVTIKRQLENTLKKNEKKLRELNATKDKFFSIIAHDLRSPFNAIIGFSEMLFKKHSEYDAKKREQIIKLILSSSKETYDLLENLLQWAKTQIDNNTYNPEKHEVQTIIFETLFNTENIAKSKKIKLISAISENLSIYADKNMIQTILRNLITNAIKFTKEGGVITIDAQKNKKEVIFSVNDTGIGISKEKIGKLFDITEKTNTLGTNNETGTGLGLILCKEFTEKHKGKIWVESILGKGSSFKFTIPLKIY